MAEFKEKNCQVCGELYIPTSPKQKACPAADCVKYLKKVKNLAAEVRRKEKRRREGACLICGNIYSTTDGKQKYCGSSSCELERLRRKSQRVEAKRLPILRRLTKERQSVRHLEDALKAAEFFGNFGYILISDRYINNTEKLKVVCPVGHEWNVAYHNFKDQDNRCPECQKYRFQSTPEREIIDFFRNCGINPLVRDKTAIGKELDLYFPEKKLAVEYCGLHWHGEVYARKHRGSHRDKFDSCKEKGIRLITIFEDEFLDRRDVVLSRIQSSLDLVPSRIYARSCDLKEVNLEEAREFFSSTHLQGSSSMKVCFGLYNKGVLVQAISLGSISRFHASNGRLTIELKRLSSLPDKLIVGGASRLFKQAVIWAKKENYSCIKSYCDMRWANPFKPVYETLGFELLSETKYTPHYFKGQKRYRNQTLRKTAEERLTGKTEWELRREQGYDRIWDCGHRTYVYNFT